MTSINFGTLLTRIFVLVDDCYQQQVKKTTVLKPGIKPSISDSEMMTLALLKLSMAFVYTLLQK
ncbi:hypothetical protein [Nostoc sp.]|uniref:hypothetical protein n=1 Tax=Nostoc sp. TaxID=1180 RepID=UPI002FFA6A25